MGVERRVTVHERIDIGYRNEEVGTAVIDTDLELIEIPRIVVVYRGPWQCAQIPQPDTVRLTEARQLCLNLRRPVGLKAVLKHRPTGDALEGDPLIL